jgi:hypothetical protein
MPKYEIWGRAKKDAPRKRLAFGFITEAEARKAMREVIANGFIDVVPVQRPVRYGRIKGLQRKGRSIHSD